MIREHSTKNNQFYTIASENQSWFWRVDTFCVQNQYFLEQNNIRKDLIVSELRISFRLYKVCLLLLSFLRRFKILMIILEATIGCLVFVFKQYDILFCTGICFGLM